MNVLYALPHKTVYFLLKTTVYLQLKMQSSAVHCTVLLCNVLQCSVMQRTKLYCSLLQFTALQCPALHCIVVHSTVLGCTALHYIVPTNTLNCLLLASVLQWSALHCIVLQCSALNCSVMHCTALYSSALHCEIKEIGKGSSNYSITTLCVPCPLHRQELHQVYLWLTGLWSFFEAFSGHKEF